MIPSTSQNPTNGFQYSVPAVDARSRRPGRTNRTQLKLFQAALEIMSEKGPSSTTVEEVALRAGVSKGTVYYNFGSKKTMVEQLLQYGAMLLKDEITLGAQKSDPREAMRGGIRAAFEYLEQHPGFARLWIAEVWRGRESWSDTMIQIRAELINELERMVHRISTRYTVDTAQDPEAIAVAIFGATFMLSMDHEIHNATRTAQDATRAVMLTVDAYISH